eukprot:SAG25_NODE_4738_length_758_cov_1.403642_1_plen_252_part_11
MVMCLEQFIVMMADCVVGYTVLQHQTTRQAALFLYADDCSKTLSEARLTPAMVEQLLGRPDFAHPPSPCVDGALDMEVVWSAGTGGKHSEEKQKTCGRGVLARYPTYHHPIANSDRPRTVWAPEITVLGAVAATLWRQHPVTGTWTSCGAQVIDEHWQAQAKTVYRRMAPLRAIVLKRQARAAALHQDVWSAVLCTCVLYPPRDVRPELTEAVMKNLEAATYRYLWTNNLPTGCDEHTPIKTIGAYVPLLDR